MQTRASGSRFAGLDHLRALAIIIVFVYHYNIFGHPPGLYDHLGSWGWTGVDLFFVLSGYLIGGQLFATTRAKREVANEEERGEAAPTKFIRDQPILYSEFYFKRALRILPAYFVVLALYLMIPAFKERSQLPPLWRMITFTQNFGLDLTRDGAFSHAWSLCIEEQFYLVLPLLIIALTLVKAHKKAAWLLVGLFGFGLAIRTFIWFDVLPSQPSFGIAYYKFIYYPTWSRLDGLLAGVALAAFYYFQPAAWQRLTKHGNILLSIALALVAGAWLIAHDDNQYKLRGAIFGYPAIAIAYGALVLAALSPSCLLYRYSSFITRTIATLS